MSCWPGASAATDRDPVRHRAHRRGCLPIRRALRSLHRVVHGLRLAGRPLLLPTTVAAEVGYLLDRLGGPEREAGFLAGVAEGAFELVDLTKADFARMAELVMQYDDMRLGTTDASVIALAERLGITEIATLDRRHFTAVRPRHVEALSLLPERF